MSSPSTRKISSEESHVMQCEDRISNLPSSLITEILSRLPTKDAVVTSVLSTKWKRSWASVSNLDFVSMLASNPESDLPTFKKFTSFVTQVLLKRDKSSLQKFLLQGNLGYDGSLINAWLVAVLPYNVQKLDISVDIKHPLLLPPDVFRCSSLVDLKLNVRGSYINMRTSVCLPSLKTLDLEGVQFPNNVSIICLLSGCPVLENLCLSHCVGEDVRAVNITARVLKRLSIFYFPYDLDDPSEYQVVIDTPALEDLFFVDRVAKVYKVNNMDHLFKAYFHFDYATINEPHEVYSKGSEDFLKGISKGEKLDLSIGPVATSNLTLPKFSNLSYLEIDIAGDPEFVFLAKLLENSPCLEKLSLMRLMEGHHEIDLGLPFPNVPSCFLFRLREIVIHNSKDVENEMKIIEYILKNARVLEKFTLYCEAQKVNANWSKELLSLPRASASTICKITCYKKIKHY